jgi:hypothetical protein
MTVLSLKIPTKNIYHTLCIHNLNLDEKLQGIQREMDNAVAAVLEELHVMR